MANYTKTTFKQPKMGKSKIYQSIKEIVPNGNPFAYQELTRNMAVAITWFWNSAILLTILRK
jgi:hypothetical protein